MDRRQYNDKNVLSVKSKSMVSGRKPFSFSTDISKNLRQENGEKSNEIISYVNGTKKQLNVGKPGNSNNSKAFRSTKSSDFKHTISHPFSAGDVKMDTELSVGLLDDSELRMIRSMDEIPVMSTTRSWSLDLEYYEPGESDLKDINFEANKDFQLTTPRKEINIQENILNQGVERVSIVASVCSGVEGLEQTESSVAILHQSDGILRDALQLCDKLGLEPEEITGATETSALAKNQSLPDESDEYDVKTPTNLDEDNREGHNHYLNSTSGAVSILNESGVTSPLTVLHEPDNDYYFNYEDDSSNMTPIASFTPTGEDGSRGTSSSFLQDEAYANILYTLQQIEDEESKKGPVEINTDWNEDSREDKETIPSEANTKKSQMQLEPSCGEVKEKEEPQRLSSVENKLGRGSDSTEFYELPDALTSNAPSELRMTESEGDLNVPINSARSCSQRIDSVRSRDDSCTGKTGTSPSQFCNVSKSTAGTPRSTGCVWNSSDEKTRRIFSFLDEVEKGDRETLFSLKYCNQRVPTNDLDLMDSASKKRSDSKLVPYSNATADVKNEFSAQTINSLIRKGPVQLAKEVVLLDRKIEESSHQISVLEETLLNQRELNLRNIKNAEKELKKRLNLQKEEFESALTRHQSFVDQLISEKRVLQDRLEKIFKDSKDKESRLEDRIKSLESKHLDEIKRIRKAQVKAENAKKQQWLGSKTKEIKELTVKGLEPELQRIIQRHQQEMSEMRAWHADEIRDIEDRYKRRMSMQADELKQHYDKLKDEALQKEMEVWNRKLETLREEKEKEMEVIRSKCMVALEEEQKRFAQEEQKFNAAINDSVRKVEIKSNLEQDSMKKDFEAKLELIEKRHQNELVSIKEVLDVEKKSSLNNLMMKHEVEIAERVAQTENRVKLEKDNESKERESRLRAEYERIRRQECDDAENRIRRIQEKYNKELIDNEKCESELKERINECKAVMLAKDEEIFTLKTALNLKDNLNTELQTSNRKMLEERSNITAVIRRDFIEQIDNLDLAYRSAKNELIEFQTKYQMELEEHEKDLDKVKCEKDCEIEKIGLRVKQAVCVKEETIQELQIQLEKSNFRIQHLEELLEQQRKELVKSLTEKSNCKNKDYAVNKTGLKGSATTTNTTGSVCSLRKK